MGISIALVCTVVGIAVFDLSFWTGLLVYSVSGTAATLLVAWRRFRCIDHHEMPVRRG